MTYSQKKLEFMIDRKLSKDEINTLPIAAYRGPLHIVRSHKAMLRAVKVINGEDLLGFDTETRPSFRKGTSYPPALIQMATRKAVFIFQLCHVELSDELIGILSNPDIIKTGVAIKRDVKELRDVTDFVPNGFVDLGECARKKGLQHHGLRGLSALLIGCRISKGARLTNWSKPVLNRQALTYAATDAWIGRRLYEVMGEWGFIDHDDFCGNESEAG